MCENTLNERNSFSSNYNKFSYFLLIIGDIKIKLTTGSDLKSMENLMILVVGKHDLC